jgi:hypothetical protein
MTNYNNQSLWAMPYFIFTDTMLWPTIGIFVMITNGQVGFELGSSVPKVYSMPRRQRRVKKKTSGRQPFSCGTNFSVGAN